MARAIDADSLLEELKQIANEMGRISIHISDMVKVMTKCVERQPTLTPPNEWVSAKDRLPEAGALIVYANNYGNEALYGVLRAPKNERPNRYDYWAYLPKPPDRRPPEGGEDT